MDERERQKKQAIQGSRSQHSKTDHDLQIRKTDLSRAKVKFSEATIAKQSAAKKEIAQSTPRPHPQRGKLGVMAKEVDRKTAAEAKTVQIKRERDAYKKAQQSVQRRGRARTRGRGLG